MQEPVILQELEQLNIRPIFPLSITKNKILLKIISSRSKIDQLFTALEDHTIFPKISSIGKIKLSPLLTKRQEEVLLMALNLGYFTIPKKISAKELGKRLNISASAVSENIRRIYTTLGNEYVKNKFKTFFS